MVTSRILDRRRQAPGRGAASNRRRRRSPSWPLEVSSAAAERLRLSAFGRIYLTAAVVIALGICYLLVAAQVTQSSYELNKLRGDQSQLLAEQDQLKFRVASLRTPARVDQDAAAAGLHQGKPAQYIGYQPVAIDLAAPIGPAPADDLPPWQQAVAALLTGIGTTRDVVATER